MTAPRFSVLIPARDRPDTLRHTLATVAAQGGGDYEIVVADNCGGAEIRRIAEQFAGPALRYLRSDEILPMAANWERGLGACSGEYVTVLGDDDAFLPSTLAAARKLIALTQAELISWRAHVYWWPDTIAYWHRNRLFVNLGGGASPVKSRPTLEQFYRARRLRHDSAHLTRRSSTAASSTRRGGATAGSSSPQTRARRRRGIPGCT
jgi:glycosyltransferase involved in cell wall biosynthesis